MKKIYFIALMGFILSIGIAHISIAINYGGDHSYYDEGPANYKDSFIVDYNMSKCTRDSDCTVVETACCSCYSGGDIKSIKGINKKYKQSFLNQVNEKCDGITCPMHIRCSEEEIPKKAICVKKEKKPWEGIDRNIRTCQVVVPTTTIPSKPFKNIDDILSQITPEMDSCEVDTDCAIIKTDCCSCSTLYNSQQKGFKTINKDNFTYFDLQLKNFCNNKTCEENDCAEEFKKYVNYNNREAPQLECINKKCQLVNRKCTDIWEKSNNKPVFNSQMQSCNVDNDCDVKMFGYTGNTYSYCGTVYLTNYPVGVSKKYIKASNSIKNYLNQSACARPTPECVTYIKQHNIKYENVVCENKLCKAVVIPKQIPSPFLKPDTDWLSYFKISHSTKTSIDPTPPITLPPISSPTPQPIENNTIKINLLKQGFFFKENRDSNKINFRVIDKNSKPVCGDGRCDILEQYLYELDFSDRCSPLAEKTINFYHCPTDCSDSLDSIDSIKKEEFNLLKFNCVNEKEEKTVKDDNTIIVSQKSIDQMNATEKNQYIATLQTYLIQLLTKLLTLLKGG